jgi:dolichol-phosphate mannosyltransferase
MKCYRAEVLREVRLYGELHRFIPVLAAARGFRIGELAINHRPRKFGHSKYGMRRFVKGFLDLLTVKFLTSFRRRPQHLLGSVGLASFLLGGLILLWLAIDWVGANWFGAWPPRPLHERPLLIYGVAALLMGTQLMAIGFLAELITHQGHEDEDSYSIAEKTGVRSQDSAVKAIRAGPGEGRTDLPAQELVQGPPTPDSRPLTPDSHSP